MVLDHPSSNVRFAKGAFSFDVGLVYPLLNLASNCRDRRLRREAMETISGRAWREAGWVSQMCADTVLFLVEMEEDGVETDYIPEWVRARLTGIDANLEERTAHLRCIGAWENRLCTEIL
jgi:hypothetical protein